MTPLQWLFLAVGIAILSAAAGLGIAAWISTETPDVESNPLPPARARRRDGLHEHVNVGPLSTLRASERRPAYRDETIGRDQFGAERQRHVRDLQPFTLRQGEALGLVKKEHQ